MLPWNPPSFSSCNAHFQPTTWIMGKAFGRTVTCLTCGGALAAELAIFTSSCCLLHCSSYSQYCAHTPLCNSLALNVREPPWQTFGVVYAKWDLQWILYWLHKTTVITKGSYKQLRGSTGTPRCSHLLPFHRSIPRSCCRIFSTTSHLTSSY